VCRASTAGAIRESNGLFLLEPHEPDREYHVVGTYVRHVKKGLCHVCRMVSSFAVAFSEICTNGMRYRQNSSLVYRSTTPHTVRTYVRTRYHVVRLFILSEESV
jgi:hypothetical protein